MEQYAMEHPVVCRMEGGVYAKDGDIFLSTG